MVASARVLHIQITSARSRMYGSEITYVEVHGFAIMAVCPTAKYSDAYEFVRVWFRKAPERHFDIDGVVIEKVELARWDETGRATDENGEAVPDSVFVAALQPAIRNYVRRESDHLAASVPGLFHVLALPKIEQEIGKPLMLQPVLCGDEPVPPAYAFDTWEQVEVQAAKTKGAVEACYECKAKLPGAK